MRWLLLCMCVCVAASLDLQCPTKGCSKKYAVSKEWREFYVKGDPVAFKNVETYLHINCNTMNALERPMPRFTSEFRVSEVILERCPLPSSSNASLVKALAAMNVKLQPKNGEISLTLEQFPHDDVLTSQQFSGLDQLTNFTMGYSMSKLSDDIFSSIPNLRSLKLHGQSLPSGGLSSLPRGLKSLELKSQSTEMTPETLPELLSETQYALPNLVDLSIHRRYNTGYKAVIRPQKKETSSLETLSINYWPEKLLAPLEHLENLRIFEIAQSRVEELPERMLQACPRLEELIIRNSDIKSFPAKLLEGASALKRVSLTSGNFKSLPEGFFQSAPNLVAIDLSFNGFHTLPSGVFSGLPRLQSVMLRQNRLSNDVLNELAPLTSLTEINLGANSLTEICEKNGYSPLIKLINLKRLDVSQNSNTRICRDWRENMKFLEYLNTDTSSNTYLEYSDFEYERDASVKNAIVRLSGYETIVNFTEDDYKKALTAPESAVTLLFTGEDTMSYSHFGRKCDCRMYWLRRAMQDAKQAIKIQKLKCSNNWLLEDLTLEKLCPELASAATAKP